MFTYIYNLINTLIVDTHKPTGIPVILTRIHLLKPRF